MKAVHFGAGNIGRGFIGEVLYDNGFETTFIDVNKEIIDGLNEVKEYTIELAQTETVKYKIKNVSGINSIEEPEKVSDSFIDASIVTTAVIPHSLPSIAPLIAEGIRTRKKVNSTEPLDIIACENMINASDFLKEEVIKYLSDDEVLYLEKYIGFPNSVIDRIVPLQTNEDKLYVLAEPHKEWVIEKTLVKNKAIQLSDVIYAEKLLPYIERKLFTVNTGHVGIAYAGKYAGYNKIDEALNDESVKREIQNTLNETGALLVNKWGFDAKTHEEYINTVFSRFSNKYISDDITHVGRGPIRKLGYNERFIQPLREAYERDLPVDYLARIVAKALAYRDPSDEESNKLEEALSVYSTEDVIKKITGLKEKHLIQKVANEYANL